MKKNFPWRTLLKALAFLIASLVTLLTCLSFTGRRDLAQTKKDLLARGEKLSFTELLPPPVPPEQNLFADPLWDELTDLVDATLPENPAVPIKVPRLPDGQRQLDGLFKSLDDAQRQSLATRFPEFPATGQHPARDIFEKQRTASSRDPRAAEFILAATAPAEPTLARLIELAERPAARFPLDYAMLTAVVERTRYLMAATQLLEMRAWAHLTLGETEKARREVLTMLRLSEALSREPMLISVLVHLATEFFPVRALDDGLKARLWTDSDLAAFATALAPIQILPSISLALRGERGGHNQIVENLAYEKNNPFPAWYRWAIYPGFQATHNRLLQAWIDAIDQATRTGYSPSRTISMQPLEEIKNSLWKRTLYLPATIMPNMINIATQGAILQNRVDQTRLVCALERHRLAHGAYPENLNALIPEFLPALPPDVVNRQPPHYRREAPDRFLLWSVGDNEIDDHGGGNDWVWGRDEF